MFELPFPLDIRRRNTRMLQLRKSLCAVGELRHSRRRKSARSSPGLTRRRGPGSLAVILGEPFAPNCNVATLGDYTMELRISKERRSAIISRPMGDGVTRVAVAKINTPEELGYAIRFMTDHFVYKRSKGVGGVNDEAVRDVDRVLSEVLGSFASDVAEPNDIDLDDNEEDEYVDETQHLSGSVKGLVHYINNATGRMGAYRINDDGSVEWFTWDSVHYWNRVDYIEPIGVPGLQGKDLFS